MSLFFAKETQTISLDAFTFLVTSRCRSIVGLPWFFLLVVIVLWRVELLFLIVPLVFVGFWGLGN